MGKGQGNIFPARIFARALPAAADLTGPTLTFLGLAPRAAALALPDLQQELA